MNSWNSDNSVANLAMISKFRRKQILCVNCKLPFNVKGHTNFRKLPHILECGHPICGICVALPSIKECQSCRAPIKKDAENNAKLSPNIWLMGLAQFDQLELTENHEPNLRFQQPVSTRNDRSSRGDLENCRECGNKAEYQCQQCVVLFCSACYSKIHGRALQNHLKIPLAIISEEFARFSVCKCSVHSYENASAYCNKCESFACVACVLSVHKGHDANDLAILNEKLRPDLDRATKKLPGMLQRMKTAQKKLSKANLSNPETSDLDRVEMEISEHFARIHGILQSLEERYLAEMAERRITWNKNIDALSDQLTDQKREIEFALTVVKIAMDCPSTANITEIMEQVNVALDFPCHLNCDYDANEKITFSVEDSFLASLDGYFDLRMPRSSNYTLLRTEQLPDDYEIEVIDPEPIPNQVLPPKIIPSAQGSTNTFADRVEPVVRQKPIRGLVEGCQKLVRISHITNPQHFYVQLSNEQSQMDRVKHSLSKCVRDSTTLWKVKINKLYAVQFNKIQSWSRGRVLSISGDQEDVKNPVTYDVFDIDSGIFESDVPISRLRNLPRDCSMIPPLALKCTLYDIFPKDGEWSTDASKYMQEMLKSAKNIRMQVYDSGNEDHVAVDIHKHSSGDGDHPVSVRDTLIFLEFGRFGTHEKLRKSTESLRKYYEEKITLEQMYDVVVSHVNDPYSIYVQKHDARSEHLARLNREMSAEYGKARRKKGIIYVPEIGMPCAVTYDHVTWHRGKIIKLAGNRRVEVLLMDVGETREFEYDEIRRLSHRFMTVTALAFRVSLKDVAPLAEDDQWNLKTRQYLADTLCNKLSRMFVFTKNDDTFNVTLYTRINQMENNFNALLVQLNHARSIGSSSQCLDIPTIATNGTKNTNHQRKKLKKGGGNTNWRDKIINDEDAQTDPFKMPVNVLHVVSPDCIYVADTARRSQMQTLTDELQIFYNNYTHKKIEKWSENSTCVAYSAKDKTYNRSRIEEIESEDCVKVFFYDIGITETVTLDDLQPLSKKYSRAPARAFKVKLGGILPCGGSNTWLSTSCKRLADLIFDSPNDAFYISKMTGAENDALSVELWSYEYVTAEALTSMEVEAKSLNRTLVEEGLALSIKGFIDDSKKLLTVELRQHLLRDNSTGCISRNANLLSEEDANYSDKSPSESRNSDSTSAPSNLTDAIDNSSDEEAADGDVEYPIPCPLAAWLPPVPISYDQFVATGSYVDHECVVYLRPMKDDNTKKLADIDQELQKQFANKPSETCDMIWAPNDLCIAQYHGDKKWYRGQVVNILKNGNVKVVFVDYGNVENCNPMQLRKRVILGHIPIQTTKCVIHNLVPETLDGKWPESLLDIIHALLVQKVFHVTVYDRKKDHLVVSIELPRFENANIRTYLEKNLRFTFRNDLSNVNSSIDSSSDDADVVVEDDLPGHVSKPVQNPIVINMESDNSTDKENDYDEDELVTASFNCNRDEMESDLESGSEAKHALDRSWPTNLYPEDCGRRKTSTPRGESDYTIWGIPDDIDILLINLTGIADPMDPTTFYGQVHEIPDTTMISGIRGDFEHMNTEMQTQAPKLARLRDIKEGDSCSVKYDDGKWYRGGVTAVDHETRKANVYYVDYGYTKYLPFEAIRYLKPEWGSVTVMCLQFRFWKLQLAPDVSNTQCFGQLESTVYGRSLIRAKIMNRCNDIVEVELYLDDDCTKLCYESLIQEGIFIQQTSQ